MKQDSLLCIFIFFTFLVSLQAEETKSALVIRSIYASGSHTESQKIEIPSSLKDIQSELESLPFGKFKLLESLDRSVSLKEKETIKLSSGDKISIRPLYYNSGKLCFWFKWVDKNGLKILDSKLHVERGMGVIAGADSSEKEAILISLTLP